MRAVIVAAVSTGAQAAEEKYSIPQQLQVCRDLCERRGWEVVGKVAVEGHSRNYNWLDELCADCPQFAELMGVVRSGNIDLVVVRDLDRLWRTDALRAQICAVCRENRVQIFAVNQPIEPVSPERIGGADSRLIVEAVSGVISQIENENRRRRMLLGIENRIAKGLHGGWSNPAYGYRNGGDPQSPLKIHETEAGWVRWIFERRAEGWGFSAIAKELNRLGVPSSRGGTWGYTPVRHMLRNTLYRGTVHWGKFTNVEGLHEPIIDEGLWYRAQEMNTTRRISHNREPYALTGLLRCGYCGWSMVYSRAHSWRFVRCNQYAHSGGRQCRSNGHSAAPLEKRVLDRVVSALDNPEAFLESRGQQENTQTIKDQLGAIEGQIAAAHLARERWDSLYERGDISGDELLGHRYRLQSQLIALKEEQERIAYRLRDLESARASVYELQDMLNELRDFPASDLHGVYVRLIREITLWKDKPPLVVWR